MLCAASSRVESNAAADEKRYGRLSGEAKLAQFRASEPKELGCVFFGIEDFPGYHAHSRVQPGRLPFKTPEHLAASLSCGTIPGRRRFAKPDLTLVAPHHPGPFRGPMVKRFGLKPREIKASSHILFGSRSPLAAIAISRRPTSFCKESAWLSSRSSLHALSKARLTMAVVSASKDRSENSRFSVAYKN